MGGRKNGGVRLADAAKQQTGRNDHVPLTRGLIDRLAPANDRLRKVLLMELARGRVSRRIATELYERTGDEELGHLLGFFFDTVRSAELGDEELTYDISVPDNVTYVANGFVSHNTIGLLMDCDTTGVEPDLGLVKTKKLVGGGTMSIVNQTVPRALAKLGYGPDQVDEIVAYVNEHMSIVGSPHLAPEHMAVFACSMGDNTIHYSGHIRMMGAVQPFISGAISKTINAPEDVTVEDVEQIHIDAWRLGLKAVAIYRDNCKVAQPLSTTKKEREVIEGGDSAPAGSEAEAKDREIAARIAQLESALAHERERASQPVVVGAVRERLPRKRNSKTFSFRVADCEGYVTIGEYEDGRPGEVFIKVSKQGSTLAGIMDAFSIAISLGLQHQVPLATFVTKYANMKFEPAGITDDPELRIASSLLDYIFRRVGARLPDPGGARRPRHPLHPGAYAADTARRRGDGDAVRRPGRRRPRGRCRERQRLGPTDDDDFSGIADAGRYRGFGSAPGAVRTARRAVLLQLRQRHAAGRLVLRVRQLRVDERVLVMSTVNQCPHVVGHLDIEDMRQR